MEPGEHSASITPWWTPISLILSFQQHLKHFADIIWEALGLSHSCSTSEWAANKQLHGGDDGNASTWPFRKEKKGGGHEGGMATSYLRTLVLMLRAWKVLGCLSEEDVSTTWHSVQKLSKTGFMTNNVREGKGDTPRLCCSYRDYQVIMHAFIYLFNTSLRGVHIIIYILGFIMLATNETPTSTHMGDTPESFRPHTNFGMAVGSMQTWNLSWLFTKIEYFFIRCYYWNIWDNPSTILPQGLQGPGGSLTLRHWRYCGGSPAATITWQLLYYCQKKHTMSIYQAIRVVLLRAVVLELLLLLLLRSLCKWFKKKKHWFEQTPFVLMQSLQLQQLTGWL